MPADEAPAVGGGLHGATTPESELLSIKCPICREETKAASLNSLRKNFALIEMFKLFTSVLSR